MSDENLDKTKQTNKKQQHSNKNDNETLKQKEEWNEPKRQEL